MKSITSWKGLKKGQKFIVRCNSNSHNYPMGVVLTLKKTGCGKELNDAAVEHCSGNNLQICDIELISNSVESLKSQLASLDKERAEVLGKISYCESNGVTEFDETEYEIFTALDVLEGTGTRKEKAAMLSKILNRK